MWTFRGCHHLVTGLSAARRWINRTKLRVTRNIKGDQAAITTQQPGHGRRCRAAASGTPPKSYAHLDCMAHAASHHAPTRNYQAVLRHEWQAPSRLGGQVLCCMLAAWRWATWLVARPRRIASISTSIRWARSELGWTRASAVWRWRCSTPIGLNSAHHPPLAAVLFSPFAWLHHGANLALLMRHQRLA